MIKKIIGIILYIKKKLPKNYQFYFIGFLSYIYLYVYVFSGYLKKIIYFIKFKNEINFINSSGKKIFVFTPSTDFFDLKQRPQHLAKAFALTGNIVIFLTKNQTQDSINGIKKVSDNLYLCNNIFLVNYIKNYNLIFIGPSNYPLLKFFKNYSKIIYDFPDELDFFPGLSKKIIEKYHKNLVFKSNLITPSASFFKDFIINDNPNGILEIILNGVFPEDFIIDNLDFIPNEINYILKQNKKVIGLYGGLNDLWVDFDLIKLCVTEKNNYNFIIIGGGDLDYIINKYNFGENKNLYFLGVKKYNELKYYAKFFDAALIPFRINKLTLGVSPVKSFEYMVQGIPFISTALPECRKYTNVLIGENYDDFINKIDIGINLKHNLDYVNKLKEEGKNNTWQSRVNLIIKKLYNE